MNRKLFILSVIILVTLLHSSCKKEDLFEQPSVEVKKVTLLELPSEYANIEVDLSLSNNDTREVHIADVEYQAVIEGVSSQVEIHDIDQDILVSTPLELTLPLTLTTSEALPILAKLYAGEELAYTVTGTFHVNDPILSLFDLPINISGTTAVDFNIEEFYEQPEVSINDISVTYSMNPLTGYTFNLEVDCTIENPNELSVVVDEVEYTVTVEGVKSDTHLYSDTYDTDINLAGESTISLVLPVNMSVGLAEGAALGLAIADGSADYILEGEFYAIEVDGIAADFLLPLYDAGSVPATVLD